MIQDQSLPDYAILICASSEIHCKTGIGCEIDEWSVAYGVMGVRLMGGRELVS